MECSCCNIIVTCQELKQVNDCKCGGEEYSLPPTLTVTGEQGHNGALPVHTVPDQ